MAKIDASSGRIVLLVLFPIVGLPGLMQVLLNDIGGAGLDFGNMENLTNTSAMPLLTSKQVDESLLNAEKYFQGGFVRDSGHIILYKSLSANGTGGDDNTNSEALSYYLLWTAESGQKQQFDKALDFVSSRMLDPGIGYMRWRLQGDDTIVNDGGNIATDADLRTIKALLVAEKKWGDGRYTALIDSMSSAIEKVAITPDKYLAPYGGASGPDSFWTAKEVWLSYSDFTVFQELSKRRGEPWQSVYGNMKKAILGAQIWNGLYNTVLTEGRQYGNSIDDGGYSINSLWIMVRSAESGDPELRASAEKSLDFYKSMYGKNKMISLSYDSSGNPKEAWDSPWVYALVGRAAVALGDMEFGSKMISRLLEFQIKDKGSKIQGAFPEGDAGSMKVGQFTMQESILTLLEYKKYDRQVPSI